MPITNLYELAFALVGTLPPEMNFIYAIVTLLLSLLMIFLAFIPFIFGWYLVKRW